MNWRNSCYFAERLLNEQQLALSLQMGGKETAMTRLGMFAADLRTRVPSFGINHNQLQILREPKDFYNELKSSILSAKRHVFLATMYIGSRETDLATTIDNALAGNRNLNVSILVDGTRSTREYPNPSCASLLTPLLRKYPERFHVSMFQTPKLRGLRRMIIPKRVNETLGLQHMKFYGFDDDKLIISGANLSNDYFTNRQDRYHILKDCPGLVQYFKGLHDTISSLSFDLIPNEQSSTDDFRVEWTSKIAPNPLVKTNQFKKAASLALASFLRNTKSPVENTTAQTIIFPLLQLSPLLVDRRESTLNTTMIKLLQLLSLPCFNDASWVFTAGYFNIEDQLLETLVKARNCIGTVITASEHANGFFKSGWPSSYIPNAYTLLEYKFLKAISQDQLNPNISLREWKRGIVNEPEGWSYHAKGIWITADSNSSGPAVAITGSSNFTKRSNDLDLEASLLLITAEQQIQSELQQEINHLETYSNRKTMSNLRDSCNHIGLEVKILTSLLGNML